METERKMPTVGTLLAVPGGRDHRRTISEYNAPDMSFSVQRFDITGHDPLGNHYHKLKSETFVITRGFGNVVLASVDEAGELLGVTRKHRLAPNSVIHVPPMTVHAFFFETEDAQMYCWSSAGYDPASPDTYGCRLV